MSFPWWCLNMTLKYVKKDQLCHWQKLILTVRVKRPKEGGKCSLVACDLLFLI